MTATVSAQALTTSEVARCQSASEPLGAEMVEACWLHLGCRHLLRARPTCESAGRLLTALRQASTDTHVSPRELLADQRHILRLVRAFREGVLTPATQRINQICGPLAQTRQAIEEGLGRTPGLSVSKQLDANDVTTPYYVGQLEQGQMSGWGFLVRPDGSLYAGTLLNGAYSGGPGDLVRANGARILAATFVLNRAVGMTAAGDAEGSLLFIGRFLSPLMQTRRSGSEAQGARVEAVVVDRSPGEVAGEGRLWRADYSNFQGSVDFQLVPVRGKWLRPNGSIESEGEYQAGRLVRGRRYAADGSFEDVDAQKSAQAAAAAAALAQTPPAPPPEPARRKIIDTSARDACHERCQADAGRCAGSGMKPYQCLGLFNSCQSICSLEPVHEYEEDIEPPPRNLADSTAGDARPSDAAPVPGTVARICGRPARTTSSCPADVSFIRSSLVYAENRDDASLFRSLPAIVKEAMAGGKTFEQVIDETNRNIVAIDQTRQQFAQNARQTFAGDPKAALAQRCGEGQASMHCAANLGYHKLTETIYTQCQLRSAALCTRNGSMDVFDYRPVPLMNTSAPSVPAPAESPAPKTNRANAPPQPGCVERVLPNGFVIGCGADGSPARRATPQ